MILDVKIYNIAKFYMEIFHVNILHIVMFEIGDHNIRCIVAMQQHFIFCQNHFVCSVIW